jgi:hypothetical protein
VRQDYGRKIDIKLEQVALGDTEVGPEDLAQVGKRTI